MIVKNRGHHGVYGNARYIHRESVIRTGGRRKSLRTPERQKLIAAHGHPLSTDILTRHNALIRGLAY